MNNSLDMMNKFNTALEDIENINLELSNIKSSMDTKLNIINNYNLYVSNQLENLRLGSTNTLSDRTVFNYHKDKLMGGEFSSYCQVVHADFVKMPTNVFNFITETGPLYKDNAVVEFYDKDEDGTLTNKDYKYNYCNILKHEADISKEDVFKVFEKDVVTIAVQVNVGNLSGGTTFNMIELCPYLPGSFSIEAIRIWTIDQYYKKETLLPEISIYDPYTKLGSTRIALDRKVALYRIEFDIHILYQMNGYPFGLRHLYFLNADMDTESDYLVVKVEKEDYIDSVGQDIIVITPHGNIETTADKYGVEYYMFYDNNALQTPISNPIARNIKTFYAKVPLREPLIGIEFKDVQLR